MIIIIHFDDVVLTKFFFLFSFSSPTTTTTTICVLGFYYCEKRQRGYSCVRAFAKCVLWYVSLSLSVVQRCNRIDSKKEFTQKRGEIFNILGFYPRP